MAIKKIMLAFLLCMAMADIGFAQMVASMVHEDYLPYFTDDPRYPKGGLVTEVTDAIYRDLGIQTAHTYHPYARAVIEFQKAAHPIHLGNFLVFSETEKEHMAFIPIVWIKFSFFSYKYNQLEYKAYSELKPYRIGTYLGAPTIPLLAEHGVRLAPKRSTDLMVHMLEKGRLDYVVDEALGFATRARDIFPERQIFVSRQHLIKAGGGIAFNFRHPDGKALYLAFKPRFRVFLKTGRIRAMMAPYYDYVGWDTDEFIWSEPRSADRP